MGRLIVLALIAMFAACELQAQAPPQAEPSKPLPDVNQLAANWVDQFNGLCKWYLTMDGKEDGAAEAVERMMNILAPDVLAQVPPHDEDQLGPVWLVGKEQVRKWLEKIAKTQVLIKYKIQQQTEGLADGELMVHYKPLPWGGISVSFQVLAAYSLRSNRQRFLELGAVFLQYGEDGKIHRFRLLLSEKREILDNPDNEI